MLIDGGPPDTWPLQEARLRRMGRADQHFDVVVVTHIDNDHIGRIIPFLQSDLADNVDDFWFNGRSHLPDVPKRSKARTQSRAPATYGLRPFRYPRRQAG
jgi:glyoxylase-like metal-dependent hydrolase (beta-lactamase superfamily II)